jgi:hypothetical protein
MARTISCCARRTGIDTVFAVEDDGRYRPTGLARRPGLRDQRQVPTRRRPDLLGPARSRRPPRRIRGLPAQLPAQLALQSQGHLPRHPQWFIPMDRPSDAGSQGEPSFSPPPCGEAGWGCGCGAAARSCGAHPLPNPSPPWGGA